MNKRDEEVIEKVNNFFSKRKLITYKKNEYILHSHDEPSGIFFLKKGYVKQSAVSKEGEELTLVIYRPRSIFPIRWGLINTPNRYSLQAMTNVEVLRSPKEDFINFLKNNPDVLFDLTKRILVRITGLMERMEYLVFGDAHQKLASMLYILSQRFGKKNRGETEIKIPLTHKEIASLVGLTRETVTLEIGKLIKKGIISDKNKIITIKNLQKLTEESLLS